MFIFDEIIFVFISLTWCKRNISSMMAGVDISGGIRQFVIFLVVLLQICSPVTSYNATFLQREVNGQCRHNVHYNNGRVLSHLGTGHYADDKDCQVTITVEPERRIFLRFDRFDVPDSTNCFQDEVLVYDGVGISSPMLSGRLYGLCGPLPRQYRAMYSSGNEVTIRFITDDVTTDNNGFAVSYVSYVPGNTVLDSTSCFQCRESPMCIDRQLMCDNLWHCPEGSDEDFDLCYESQDIDKTDSDENGWLSWTGTHLAMAFAAAAVLFIIASLIFCCCCYRSSSENFVDSSASTQIVADANMYYIQQAKPDAAIPTTAEPPKKESYRSYSSYDEDEYDVIDVSASEVGSGFHSPGMPRPMPANTTTQWIQQRRSLGDGCTATFPCIEVHRQNLPEGCSYDAETPSRTRPGYYVTDMSFIQEQERRWQYLTGQNTRVALPPEDV